MSPQDQDGTGKTKPTTNIRDVDDVNAARLTFEDQPGEDGLLESIAMLDESERDIKAGRTLPAKEAIRRIAAVLNLKLDR
jgi:hypothetical protein